MLERRELAGDVFQNVAGASPMSEFKQSFDRSDKEYARALLGVIEHFKSIRPTMPIQHAFTFLLVTLEEGLTVSEYADKAGVSQSVMTRHLLDIGERNRKKEEGFGLVFQKPDPMDLRKHRAFLTPEGRALYHKLMRSMARLSKGE